MKRALGFGFGLVLLSLVALNVQALANPVITAVSPANGPTSGGTKVTVSGTGFSQDLTMGAISAGDTQSCAVDSTANDVKCWGNNVQGALGNNTTTNSNVPVTVNTASILGTSVLKQISAGGYENTNMGHACALTQDNKISCWGANLSGQVGNNNFNNALVPQAFVGSAAFNAEKIRYISAGGAHTCALAESGNAYCWGEAKWGQLGNGATGNSANTNIPVLVNSYGSIAGKKITSINATALQTCATTEDGAVHCWGYNMTALPVSYSTGALAGKNAVSVSSSVGYINGHNCVVDDASALYCWGANGSGELGNGTTTAASAPVKIDTSFLNGAKISKVVAGRISTCILADDGKVFCWGANNYGQLNNNTTTNSSMPVNITENAALAGKRVIDIAAGGNHYCATTADKQAICWGYGGYGQVGNGVTTDVNKTATQINNLSASVSGSKVQVTVGGSPATRIAGDDKTISFVTPAHAAGANNIVITNTDGTQATAGFEFLAAPTISSISPNRGVITGGDTITITGTNFRAGAKVNIDGNDITPLSISDTTITFAAPVLDMGKYDVSVINSDLQKATLALAYSAVSLAPTVSKITPVVGADNGGTKVTITGTGFLAQPFINAFEGHNHSCIINSNQSLACWGDNNYGALGDGTTTNSATPRVVGGLLSGKRITQVAVAGNGGNSAGGWQSTCALTETQEAYCWGGNNYGQLGDGTTTNRSLPVKVNTTNFDGNPKFIAAGAWHTCALTTTNKIYCWGYNQYGELGNGTTTNSLTPVQVNTSALSSPIIRNIATSTDNACLLDGNGNEYCWGRGNYGQNGDGTTTDRKTPTLINMTGELSGKTIKSLGNVHADEDGLYRTCSISSDDKVYCWGYGGYNNMPDASSGSGSNSSVPRLLGSATTGFKDLRLKKVANSTYHTCALATTGEVYCWGASDYGQVGGVTGSSYGITKVNVGGQKAVDLMVAARHTCAITENYQVYCWGTNISNRLGNTGPSSNNVPTQVAGLQSTSRMVTASGLLNPLMVNFGGSSVEANLVDGGTITATTPAHTKGLVDVSVVSPDNQTGALPQSFEYLAAPTISAITPNKTSIAGGDSVIISGTGFRSGMQIKLGTATITPTSVSDTSVAFTAPAMKLGPYDVAVVNPDGQTATSVAGLSYVALAPTISAITPAFGAEKGGTSVTITGTNFQPVPKMGTVGVNEPETLPAKNRAQKLAVIGDKIYMFGGYAGSTYSNAIISAPVSNPKAWTTSAKTLPVTSANAVLTRVGSKLYLMGGATTNKIIMADVSDPTSWVDTGKTLPASVVAGNIATLGDKLYIFGGNDNKNIYSANISDPTTWTATGAQLPQVQGSSSFLKVNDKLYLFGGTVSGWTVGDVILVADAANPLVWKKSDKTLVNSGNPVGGAAVVGDYIYLIRSNLVQRAKLSDPLAWSSYFTLATNRSDHSIALIDDKIYLYGGWSGSDSANTMSSIALTDTTYGVNIYNDPLMTNWPTDKTAPGVTDVAFDGISATNITYVDAKTIAATTPAHVKGKVDVRLTNVDGQSATLAQGYEYLDAPVISTVSPSSGPTAGGTVVTLTGSGLRDGSKVRIGTNDVTPSSADGQHLVFTTPAGDWGATRITVIGPDGQTASLDNAFTYISPAPKVTSIIPSNGMTKGGEKVTVKGENFTSKPLVNSIDSYSHFCVITDKKSVACWGDNPYGAVGDGTTTIASTPKVVGGLLAGKQIKQVEVGGYGGYTNGNPQITCSLTTDGEIYCWGQNQFGQLGDGTTTNRSLPVKVDMTKFDGEVRSIAVAALHVCALTTTSKVYCWGYNINGDLGNGTTANSTTPTLVQTAVLGGAKIKSMVAHGGATCVLTDAGKVFCWGANRDGQLGDGSNTTRTTPVQVVDTGELAGKTIKSLGASKADEDNYRMCAVASDDKVYCWGYGGYGNMIDSSVGNNNNSNVPRLVGSKTAGFKDAKITKVANSTYHTCALSAEDEMYCWGHSISGQAGTYNDTSAITKIAIPGSVGIRDISVGSRSTCAITLEGKLYCWGLNVGNRLGVSGANTATPTLMATAPTDGNLLPATVNFGGSSVSAVVKDTNTLTVVTPAHAKGVVDVTVTNGDGQNTTLANSFEYIAPPSISTISPNTGLITGGDTVAIYGNDFRSGAKVQVCGYSVDALLINSNILTFVTPPANYGKCDVIVTNPDGQSSKVSNGFTYLALAPDITSITPTYGTEKGGTQVTVKGANFLKPNAKLSGGWSTAGSIPAVGGGNTVVVLKDRVISYGGRGPNYSSGTMNTIMSSSISNPGQFANTGKALPGNRDFMGSFVDEKYIYLYGGRTGSGNYTNTIFRADVNNPDVVVDTGKTLPATFILPQVMRVGSDLYMYGINTILKANAADPLSWTNVTPSNLPSGFLVQNAIKINDEIYLYANDTGVIYKAPVANPTAVVDTGKRFPAVAAAAGSIIIGEDIYFFGGYRDGILGTIYTAKVYDPATITYAGELPGTLLAPQTFVVGNKAYIFGDESNKNLNVYSSVINNAESEPNVGMVPWRTTWQTNIGGNVYPNVNFGELPGINPRVVDANTLTVTTPAHDAGQVDVKFTNLDGQSKTLEKGYTYIPQTIYFANEPYLRTNGRALAGNEPAKMTLTFQDKQGKSVPMPIDITINLSSSSVGGQFARTGNDDPDPDGTRWDYNTVVIKKGQISVNFWYRDNIKGQPTITASIKDSNSVVISTGTQKADIGSRYKLRVTGITDPIKKGVPTSVTVRAVDWKGDSLAGYAGKVHFTSTDGAAILPSDYTFQTSDMGIKTFTNGVVMQTESAAPSIKDDPEDTVKTNGWTVRATDVSDDTITGAQTDIDVDAPNLGNPVKLKFTTAEQSFPSNGYSSPITAQIQDANGEGVLMQTPKDVWFVSSSSTGRFTTDPINGSWSAGPFKTSIKSGLTSTTVYYKDTSVTTATLSVRDRVEDTADNGAEGDFALINDAQSVTSGVGAPTRVAITGPSRLDKSEKGTFKLELQDENGHSSTAQTDILLRIDAISNDPFFNKDNNPETARFYFPDDDYTQGYRGPVHFLIPAGSKDFTIKMSDTTSSSLPNGATLIKVVDARPETQIIRIEDASKRVRIGMGDPVGTRISINDPVTHQPISEMPVRKNVEVHVDYIDQYGNVTYVESNATTTQVYTDSLGAFAGANEPAAEYDVKIPAGQIGANIMYYAFGAGRHSLEADITANSGVNPPKAPLTNYSFGIASYDATQITPTIKFGDSGVWSQEYNNATIGFADKNGKAIILDAPTTKLKFTTTGNGHFYNPPYSGKPSAASDPGAPNPPPTDPRLIFVDNTLTFKAGQKPVDLNFVGKYDPEDLPSNLVHVVIENADLKTLPEGVKEVIKPADDVHPRAVTDNGVKKLETDVRVNAGVYHEISIEPGTQTFTAGQAKPFNVFFLDRNGNKTRITEAAKVRLASSSARGFFGSNPADLTPEKLSATDPKANNFDFDVTPDTSRPDRAYDYLTVYYYDETAGSPNITVADVTEAYPPTDSEAAKNNANAPYINPTTGLNYNPTAQLGAQDPTNPVQPYGCGSWKGDCPVVNLETGEVRLPQILEKANTNPQTTNLLTPSVQNPQIRSASFAQKVVANIPAKLTFLNHGHISSIDAPSNAISVGLLDRFGNVTAAGDGGLDVNMSANSDTGGFAASKTYTSADFTPSRTIHILAGAMTADFYYMDSVSGTYDLNATSEGLTADKDTITVTEAWLKLTQSYNRRPIGYANQMTVTTTDIYGNVYINQKPKTVYLYADTSTAQFSTLSGADSSDWGATQITIPTGASSLNFYARETQFNSKRDANGVLIHDANGKEIDKNDLKITVSNYDSLKPATSNVNNSSQTFEILSQPVEKIVYLNPEYTIKAGTMTENLISQAQRWDIYQEKWVPSIQRGDSVMLGFFSDGGDTYRGVGADMNAPSIDNTGNILTCHYLDALQTPGYQCPSTQYLNAVNIPRGQSQIKTYYAGYKLGKNRVGMQMRQESPLIPREAAVPAGYVKSNVERIVTTNENPHYVTVKPGDAARINFATPERTIKAGEKSAVIHVDFQDKFGNFTTENPDSHTLSLASSCAAGEFSSALEPWSKISKITIPAGQHGFDFYYTDTVSGSCEVKVSDDSGEMKEGKQTLHVDPASPTRMSFNDNEKTLIKGQPYAPSVTLYDVYGNVTSFTSNTDIWITTDSTTAAWGGVGASVNNRHPDPGLNVRTIKKTFRAGEAITFMNYIDREAGSHTLSVTSFDPGGVRPEKYIEGDDMKVVTTEGSMKNLGFKPDVGQISAGGVWTSTVEILNEWLVPVKATSAVCVNLGTSIAGEKNTFLDGNQSGAGVINSVDFQPGELTKPVYYTQGQNAEATLTAKASGFNDGPAKLNVIPAAVHSMRFINEPYVDARALEIGQQEYLTVQLYDEFGNVTGPVNSPLTLYLTAKNAKGETVNQSVTVAAGQANARFSLQREAPETGTITVSTQPDAGAPSAILPSIQQNYQVVYGNPYYHYLDNNEYDGQTKYFERGDQIRTTITLLNRFKREVPAPTGGQKLVMTPTAGLVSDKHDGSYSAKLNITIPEGESRGEYWYRYDDAPISQHCDVTWNEALQKNTNYCSLNDSDYYDQFVTSDMQRIPSKTNPGANDNDRGFARFVPFYGEIVRYVFTSPEQEIYARHTSDNMFVKGVNRFGKDVQLMGWGKMLYVRSTAGSAVSEFGSSHTEWGLNMIHLPSGQVSSDAFVYHDNVPGVKTLGVGENLPINMVNSLVDATQKITIKKQVLDHFYVSNISDPQNQGTPSSVVVAAQDAENYVVDWYDGSVEFSAKDQVSSIDGSPVTMNDPNVKLNDETQMQLPGKYTFNPAKDRGEHTFTNLVGFGRAGEKTVIANDNGSNSSGKNISGKQIDITVNSTNSRPVSGLAFSQPASPAKLVRGVSSPPLTLEIRDDNGNPTMAPIGGFPVHLVSESPSARFALAPNGPWFSTLDTRIPEGFTFVNVYYKDDGVGKARITAMDWENGADNLEIRNANLDVDVKSLEIASDKQIYSKNVFGEMEESKLLFSANASGEIEGSMKSHFASTDLATGNPASADWRWYWRQGVFLLGSDFNLQKRSEIQKDVTQIKTMIGKADFYSVAQATDTSFTRPDEVVSEQLTVPTGRWKNQSFIDAQTGNGTQYVALGKPVNGHVNSYQASFEDIVPAGSPQMKILVIPASTMSMADALKNAVYTSDFLGAEAVQGFTIPSDIAALSDTPENEGKSYQILTITYNSDGDTTSQSLGAPFKTVHQMPTCSSLGLEPKQGSDGLYPNCEAPSEPEPENPGEPTDPTSPVDPTAPGESSNPTSPATTESPQPQSSEVPSGNLSVAGGANSIGLCTRNPQLAQCLAPISFDEIVTGPVSGEEKQVEPQEPIADSVKSVLGEQSHNTAVVVLAGTAAMLSVILVWDIYREIRNAQVLLGMLKAGIKETAAAVTIGRALQASAGKRLNRLLKVLKK